METTYALRRRATRSIRTHCHNMSRPGPRVACSVEGGAGTACPPGNEHTWRACPPGEACRAAATPAASPQSSCMHLHAQHVAEHACRLSLAVHVKQPSNHQPRFAGALLGGLLRDSQTMAWSKRGRLKRDDAVARQAVTPNRVRRRVGGRVVLEHAKDHRVVVRHHHRTGLPCTEP